MALLLLALPSFSIIPTILAFPHSLHSLHHLRSFLLLTILLLSGVPALVGISTVLNQTFAGVLLPVVSQCECRTNQKIKLLKTSPQSRTIAEFHSTKSNGIPGDTAEFLLGSYTEFR